MFELNAYNFLFIPSALALLCFVYTRLRNFLGNRNIPLSMPSITKSLWSELKLTWTLGKTHPKNIISFYSEQIKINGPVFHFYLTGRSYVLINDPDDLKEITIRLRGRFVGVVTIRDNATRDRDSNGILKINGYYLLKIGNFHQKSVKKLESINVWSVSEHGKNNVWKEIALRVLLSSTAYIKKGDEYDLMQPWLNTGLLLSSDEKWKNRRKLLTKAFHFSTLNIYNPSINKHSRVLAKKLLAASAGGKEIIITDYVKLCSLDIICETIMGTEMDAQEGKSSQYTRSTNNACQSVFKRIYKFWLWNDVLFRFSTTGRIFYKSIKVLHEFTDDVIKKKRMASRSSKDQNADVESIEKPEKQSFLDLLLAVLENNPGQMTDIDIREEVDTFLFEGHDTTSISLTMTLILLGMHQKCQDISRAELFDIFGDSDRDATIKDLNDMKYLDAVIRESLRLYPSVPIISRKLETTLQLKNYSVPPNATVVVIPYLVHREENLYADAEEFIPERFLDYDDKNKSPFGYIPFSAGPRNCIGQKYAIYQMKTVISTILRRMKIETLATKEDIVTSLHLVVRLESAIKMKFHEI